MWLNPLACVSNLACLKPALCVSDGPIRDKVTVNGAARTALKLVDVHEGAVAAAVWCHKAKSPVIVPVSDPTSKSHGSLHQRLTTSRPPAGAWSEFAGG